MDVTTHQPMTKWNVDRLLLSKKYKLQLEPFIHSFNNKEGRKRFFFVKKIRWKKHDNLMNFFFVKFFSQYVSFPSLYIFSSLINRYWWRPVKLINSFFLVISRISLINLVQRWHEQKQKQKNHLDNWLVYPATSLWSLPLVNKTDWQSNEKKWTQENF